MPQIAHFMMILPTQNGFYEKTPPMPTKSPLFHPKREKNTEKCIKRDHFPWSGERKTRAT